MARALKYFGFFGEIPTNPSENPRDYKVEFWFDGFTGVASEIKIGGEGFKISELSANDEIHGLKEEKFTVSVLSEKDSDISADDFYIRQEEDVVVKFFANNVLEKVGYLTGDRLSEEYHDATKQIVLEGICGLRRLKAKDYVTSEGKRKKGTTTIYDKINFCLQQTGLGLPVRMSHHLHAIPTTLTNNTGFIVRYEDLLHEGQNCYEVLKQIAETLNLTIFQEAGYWYVIHFYSKIEGIRGYEEFNAAGESVTNGVFPIKQDAIHNSLIQPQNGVLIYEPALKSVKALFKLGKYKNYILNDIFEDYTGNVFDEWGVINPGASGTITQTGLGLANQPFRAKITGATNKVQDAKGIFQTYQLTDRNDLLFEEKIRKQIIFTASAWARDVQEVHAQVRVAFFAQNGSQVAFPYYLGEDGVWSNKTSTTIKVTTTDPNKKSKNSEFKFEVTGPRIDELKLVNTLGQTVPLINVWSVSISVILIGGIKQTTVPFDDVTYTPYVEWSRIGLQIIDVATNLNIKEIRYEAYNSAPASREEDIQVYFGDFVDASQLAALQFVNEEKTTFWRSDEDLAQREVLAYTVRDLVRARAQVRKIWEGQLWGHIRRSDLVNLAEGGAKYAFASFQYDYAMGRATVRMAKLNIENPSIEIKKYAILSDGTEVEMEVNNFDMPSLASPIAAQFTPNYSILDNIFNLNNIVTVDLGFLNLQTFGNDFAGLKLLDEETTIGSFQLTSTGLKSVASDKAFSLNSSALTAEAFLKVPDTLPQGETIATREFISTGVTTEFVNLTGDENRGLVTWDSDHDLLAVGLSDTFTAKIPQDAVWAGVAAVAITKGQTLYVSGTSGSSGKLLVSPFIANGTIPARFLVGIATENAAQGANVHVMRTGILRGINTTAFSAGQDLWASTTVAGGLQATVPTAPNLKLSIAFVVVSHAQVGELAVRINTGHYLADAHDTEVSNILSGQLLRHTGTRWENWTPNFLTGATGTVNTVAKFGAGNTLVNTNIVDNGSNVVFSTNIAVGTANAARNLSITRELASADSFSIFSAPTFASTVTQGFGIDSRAVLAANTALTNLWLNRTSAVTLNTGASITNLYGYFVQNYSNATNIFAFTGQVNAATNRWNLYMSGTAANYLRGNLLVNSTVDSGEAGQFTGNVKITQNLNVTTIGNAAGVTANNTWTFSSNVNVPLLPTANAHATSKQYVDNLVQTGIREGIPVRTIALSNITLSGTQTISGVAVVAGNRVLVAGQTTASQNGVYIVASGAWSRATDSDTDLELRGFNYLITEGTQANARYRNSNDSAIIVGTTAITYVIYQGAETDPIFTASPAYGITSQNITDWNTTFANWGALVPITWWDSRFAAASTTGLAEGTNLYFTNTRARAALSFTAGSGAYDSATGVITIPTNNNQITNGAGYITSSALTGYVPTSRTINGFDLTQNRTLTTSDIDEGTSLYFTNARARAAISVSTGLSYNSTTGVITNTITQYTDTLARAAISTNATGLTYSSSTGVLSISAGYQIPTTTLLNSFITENQTITLSGDVTGSGRTGIATTLASTGVVAGNYGSATTTPTFTVDAKGRLTAATAVTITPSFANVTNKPTTVAGYGITDAITGNGTAGFIPLFSGTQAIGNSVITQTLNRIGVGIGALTPSGALEVNTGSIGAWFTRIAGDAGGNNPAFQIATASSDVRLFGYGDSTSIWTAPIGGAITRRMTIFSATGNVRLGNLTTDQGERLQVAGTARITTMATGSSADSIVTVTSAGVLNKIDYSTFVPSTRTVNGLALSSNIVLTTSNISEGTNLYYTEARVNANTNVAANTAARHAAVTIGTANGLSLSGQAISLALASSTTTGALSSANWNTFNNKENAIVAGTTAQYYRGDKTFQTLNTTAVTEGTNLYFTNARSRSAISLTINPVISAPSYNASTGVLTLSDYSLLNILTDKQFTDAAAGLRQLRSIEYQANRMDFGFDKVLDVPYLYYENDGKKLVNYMDGDGVFVHVDLNGNQRQYLRAGDIAATVPTLQQVSEAGKSSSIKLQWNAVDYALITDIQAIAIPNLQQVAERGFNANIRLQFNGVNYATMSDLPAVGTVPTLSQVLNSGNNTVSSRINFNNFAEMFAVTNVLYGNGVFLGTESSTADCHIRLQGSSFEISSLRNGVILSAVQSGILQVQANSVRFGNVNYAFNQTPVLVSGNKYVFLWDGSKFVITNF